VRLDPGLYYEGEPTVTLAGLVSEHLVQKWEVEHWVCLLSSGFEGYLEV